LVFLVAVDLDPERLDRVALLAHQQREVDRAAAAERGEQQLQRGESPLSVDVDEQLCPVLVRDGHGVVGVHGHLEVTVAGHAPSVDGCGTVPRCPFPRPRRRGRRPSSA
jgi:hypothetical protein